MVGYVTQMPGDIASGIGVVAFNNAFGDTGQLADFALKTLVAAANDAPLPDLPAMRHKYAVPDAGEYTGTWTGLKTTLEIVALNEGLALQQAGEATPCSLTGTVIRWTPSWPIIRISIALCCDSYAMKRGRSRN
jgi:hypothetical protein